MSYCTTFNSSKNKYGMTLISAGIEETRETLEHFFFRINSIKMQTSHKSFKAYERKIQNESKTAKLITQNMFPFSGNSIMGNNDPSCNLVKVTPATGGNSSSTVHSKLDKFRSLFS